MYKYQKLPGVHVSHSLPKSTNFSSVVEHLLFHGKSVAANVAENMVGETFWFGHVAAWLGKVADSPA